MTVNPQLAPVTAFVRALRAAGVSQFCVSPGSRNAPLTIAAAREPAVTVWNLPDERSAGFFALGVARVTGKPVALVCTSGTAAANYLPAVVEAHYARVPLIVLTADRPPELHGVGANQTIRQTGLYGEFVKWSIDMPVPADEESFLSHARAVAARAAAVAATAPSGVVHVNYPFREPLIPPADAARLSGGPSGREVDRRAGSGVDTDGEVDMADWKMSVASGAGALQAAGAPPFAAPAVRVGVRRLAADDLAAMARELENAVRGVVVCGPLPDRRAARAIARLAARLGYPVLADPLSQLRSLDGAGAVIVDQYDTFLRFEDGRQSDASRMPAAGNAGASTGERALRPDVVLRFGQAPTSKSLAAWLAQNVQARQCVIDEEASWRDAQWTATDVWIADPAELCEDLLAQLADDRPAQLADDRSAARGWLERWREVNRVTEQELADHFAARRDAKGVFEGQVWRDLPGLLPDGSVLVVGNSMPVRDADAYFPATGRAVYMMGNRGASGIDGVVSTALGASAAQRLAGGGPTVLVIGDLSFYHDLNGLLAAAKYGLQLLVVLIHNDGGGIFSFLPPACHEDVFSHFAAAHGLDFSHAVRMYGGSHRRAGSPAELRAAVRHGLVAGGLYVIEVPSDRALNVVLHQSALDAVRRALRPEKDGHV